MSIDFKYFVMGSRCYYFPEGDPRRIVNFSAQVIENLLKVSILLVQRSGKRKLCKKSLTDDGENGVYLNKMK